MTLAQQRASLAHRHIVQIRARGKAERDAYGGMAQKLPALIRTAGLCQALHFVRSRSDNKVVSETLLSHLACQLQRVEPQIENVEAMLEQARNAGLATYLWLSREAIAALEWYARLSRSELGVDPTAEGKADEQPAR
jgi:CRISPR-associated protein Cmr5